MAQDIINKNQNISYTNLDFSSMYEEVVNLAKQLSYRWDPTISDESDPGVVLLKLSTLIADKMNYNIDKSVLESFPLSVTQQSNARQLYEQLGYYMNWYESAIVPVTLTWIEDKTLDVTTYTIPKFTIITDSESSKSYALIGVEDSTGLVVSDGKLTTDSKSLSMIAMEGTPTVFSFLGETVITPQMVDENNRLYLETKYVSQNGIFIRNSASEQANYSEWQRVDNLYEQSYNELRYKFGIDSKSNIAYLEFPDNYAELFGAGIEIVYMIVNPEHSNIPPKTLDRFLVDITPAESDEISLNMNNVKIENTVSAYGHKDIESIDDAYINYKKTVGTFNTLITLRDYLNFILKEGYNLCSNAFVTDRTNDIQSSYNIMSREKGLDILDVEIEKIEDDGYEYVDTTTTEFDPYAKYYNYNLTTKELKVNTDTKFEDDSVYFVKNVKDALTPFSLKFYMLQNVMSVSSKNTFEETFEMITDLPSLDTVLKDTSHLEHTYEDLLYYGEHKYKKTTDTEPDNNKSYYKYNENKKIYEIVTTGVYVQTTDEEWDTEKAYYKYNQSFDTYDLYIQIDGDDTTPKQFELYEIIPISDEFNPSMYNLYEIDISYLLPHIAFFKAKYPISMTITTYSIVGKDAKGDIVNNIINSLYSNLNAKELEFGEQIELDYLTKIVSEADSRIKSVVFDNINYSIEAVYYDKTNQFKTVPIAKSVNDLMPRVYTTADAENETNKYYISRDILCKSILAGTTQLFLPDDIFKYHLNQKYINLISNIATISSESIIDMNATPTIHAGGTTLKHNYRLKENEILTLYRPSLKDVVTFGSGIHYEYRIYTTITANQSHKLLPGEYFITYQSVVDDLGNITGYKSTVLKETAIIKPSFELKSQGSISGLSDYFRTQLMPAMVSSNENQLSFATEGSYWMTVIGNSSSIINNLIEGTNTITVQRLNTVEIKLDDGYKFYWTLNDERKTDSTGKKYYQLFDEYDPKVDSVNNHAINTYTLKSGENLYYIDKEGRNLAILHEGTSIIRNCGVDETPTDIPQEDLYTFVKYSDIKADIDLGTKAFQFISSTETPTYPSPVYNGFYKLENDMYVRVQTDSFDTTETYYMLLMNSMSGMYEQTITKDINNEDIITYNPSLDKTASIFEEVDLKSELIDNNPKELNYYERVSYNGTPIEDVYTMKGEKTARAYARYTNSIDDTIVTTKIFKNIPDYETVDVNDVSTYKDIILTDSNATYFNPAAQNWLTFRDNTLSDKDLLEFFNEDGQSVEVVRNTNPSLEGLYEMRPNGTIYKSRRVYPFEMKIFKYVDDSVTPFEQVENIDFNSMNVIPSGYFYRASTHSNIFKFTGNDGTETMNVLPKKRTDSNMLLSLYNLYSKVYSETATISGIINGISYEWPLQLTYNKPNSWKINSFEATNQTWEYGNSFSEGEYIFIRTSQLSRADISSVVQGVININPSSIPYKSNPQEVEEIGIFVQLSELSGDLSLLQETYTKFTKNDDVESGDNLIIVNDMVSKNIYDIVGNLKQSTGLSLSTLCNKINLYYMPLYYKFKPLCAYENKSYYKLKTYANKTFNKIDPWQCDYLDPDRIAENPIEALKNSWVQMQNNTSITISENTLWSLSEGDLLTVSSDNIHNFDTAWPVFDSSDTIIDLDEYSLSYTKTDNEIVNLEKLTIPGIYWRAFSSLLLNTSNTNGQILSSNHIIRMYDDTYQKKLIGEIRGSDTETITFQLQYPVANKLGNDIEVVSYDALGNVLLNSAYIFQSLNSAETYAYTRDRYETYLYFNKENALYEDAYSLAVQLPMWLPNGTYLIPITGVDGIDLEVELIQTSIVKYSEKTSTGIIKEEVRTIEIDTTTQLYNFVNNDRVFEGEKYKFISLELNNNTIHDELVDRLGVWASGHEKFEILSTTVVISNLNFIIDSWKEEEDKVKSPVIIVLDDIFKYNPNTQFNGGSIPDNVFDDIFNQIKRLDPSEKYNYAYIVNENDIIKDPLIPKSFWNSNHVYNKNIIAQLDTSDSDNIEYRFITSK